MSIPPKSHTSIDKRNSFTLFEQRTLLIVLDVPEILTPMFLINLSKAQIN